LALDPCPPLMPERLAHKNNRGGEGWPSGYTDRAMDGESEPLVGNSNEPMTTTLLQ
jgi:hypothetical protein